MEYSQYVRLCNFFVQASEDDLASWFSGVVSVSARMSVVVAVTFFLLQRLWEGDTWGEVCCGLSLLVKRSALGS